MAIRPDLYRDEEEVAEFLKIIKAAETSGRFEELADSFSKKFDDQINDVWLWPMLMEVLKRRPESISSIILAAIYQKREYEISTNDE